MEFAFHLPPLCELDSDGKPIGTKSPTTGWCDCSRGLEVLFYPIGCRLPLCCRADAVPNNGWLDAWPGTTGSTTAQTEWTELTTIAGGIEPNNNAQHLRSRWWPVCPSSTSLVRCAGRCNGGREGSVGRARVAQVRSARCESIPVGVDSLRGFHTGPTAGAQYIGEGSGNGDQGGCEAD